MYIRFQQGIYSSQTLKMANHVQEKETLRASIPYVAYAISVLVLSLLSYLALFAILFAHDDGGGQPTLPGMAAVAGIGLGFAAIICFGIQLILYWFIRRSRRMPVAGLLLPLPLSLSVPAFIGFLDGNSDVSVFLLQALGVNIALSAVLFFIAFRRSSKWMGYAALAHAAGIAFFIIYCCTLAQKTEAIERQVIERSYLKNEQKLAIQKSLCAGWNEKGTQAAIDLYTNPKARLDSECYYYSNGCIMTKIYRYDSLGAKYEREISFTENTFPYLRRIRNTLTKESSTTEYFKDTMLVEKRARIYDSNSRLYRERLIFFKDGKLRRREIALISNAH